MISFFRFSTLLAAVSLLSAASCNTSGVTSKSAPAEAAPSNNLPQIIIYKTSGDFADNVPITLNSTRTAVASYPAPSDVSASTSTPVRLDGGYLLDRRGISQNSVFTSYTYREYSLLPFAPAASELMSSVIPGAVVTEIVRIPEHYTSSVKEMTDICNKYIKKGLEGCEILYTAPTLRLEK